VVGPEDLVADIIDYLRGCAEEAILIERPSIPWDGDRGWLITKVGSALEPDPKPATAASDEGSGTRRPRQTATEQLARILAIVPWVAANPGVEMTEVCERFDISQRQLTDDLEHLFMVGVPPYTPDAMIDVMINDGTITVHLGEAFSRPLRLSTQQILALLVAGKAIGEVPGAPPNPALESALTKLAAHVTAADRLEVNLDPVPPSTVIALRDAIEAGATVGMRYYSVSKDETRSRWVDPLRLYAQSGHWYVDAVCHESAEERTFRVDRMSEVQLANADFVPTTPTPMPATANPASAGPAADDNFELIGIELPAASRWLLDQAYVARIDGVGTDRIAVEIPVNSDRWLGRFLVQIGPQAIVTGPLPLITAGRRAAQQALDGYLDRHSDGDRL
jgi:proteasome accessory factor C